jgi:hypothetical protein
VWLVDLSLIFLAVGALTGVILVILALPSFLGWLRERKNRAGDKHAIQQSSIKEIPTIIFVPAQTNSESSASYAATPSRKQGTEPTGSQGPTTPQGNTHALEGSKSLANDFLVFDDILDVADSGHEEVHRRLTKGTVVWGLAREQDRQPFDFYIMDQANYARFCKDRGGDTTFQSWDKDVIRFRKTLPRTSTWYFVVDTYRKQNDRAVQLEVNAEPP